jgi:hypothetical protein
VLTIKTTFIPPYKAPTFQASIVVTLYLNAQESNFYALSLNVNVQQGVSMVWCTHFTSKLKIHIISKVITYKISFTLNYSRNHI